MSDKFPLLRQLDDLKKNPAQKSPLPSGIKYDTKVLVVEGSEVEIFIPLREAEAYEQTVSEYGKYIDHNDLSSILRKHRGIRNWE